MAPRRPPPPPYGRRRPRPAFGGRDPAWRELHDYDFEMRGPYRPGRMLDAYLEWRRFREDEIRRGTRTRGEEIGPMEAAGELKRWTEWRREQRRQSRRPRPPEGPPPPRPRRRGPRWPRPGW